MRKQCTVNSNCIVQRPKPSRMIIYLDSVRKIQFYLFFSAFLLCFFFFLRRLFWFFVLELQQLGCGYYERYTITTTKIALLLAFPLWNRIQSMKCNASIQHHLDYQLRSRGTSTLFSYLKLIPFNTMWRAGNKYIESHR